MSMSKEEIFDDYMKKFVTKSKPSEMLKKSCKELYHFDFWDMALDEYAGHLKQENDEITQLFDLQHTRMTEATKYWQKKTGKKNTMPDLGNLLTFLLNEIKKP